jgi:hypothetical protein
LPLPRLIGRWLRGTLERQIRAEVSAASKEDKADIEQRGYPRSDGQEVGVAIFVHG